MAIFKFWFIILLNIVASDSNRILNLIYNYELIFIKLNKQKLNNLTKFRLKNLKLKLNNEFSLNFSQGCSIASQIYLHSSRWVSQSQLPTFVSTIWTHWSRHPWWKEDRWKKLGGDCQTVKWGAAIVSLRRQTWPIDWPWYKWPWKVLCYSSRPLIRTGRWRMESPYICSSNSQWSIQTLGPSWS